MKTVDKRRKESSRLYESLAFMVLKYQEYKMCSVANYRQSISAVSPGNTVISEISKGAMTV